MLTFYHNPMCKKSRAGLEFLKTIKTEYKVVNYFKEPFTEKDFRKLLMKLDKKPAELVRKQESVFKSHFRNRNFTDDEWIKILLEYPNLIIRPLVEGQYKAVIGDPPENISALL